MSQIDRLTEHKEGGFADEEAFRQAVRRDRPLGDGPLADGDLHIELFRAAEKALPGAGTSWVPKIREEAIRSYQEVGWPTQDLEAWKYTNLTPLRRDDWETVSRDDRGSVETADLAPFTFDDLQTHQLVFVDGHFEAELSDVGELPEAVTVAPLSTLLDEQPELLEPHLAKYADYTDQGLRALNTASFQDGAAVLVPEGTVLEDPVHVLFVHTDRDRFVTHPRNLFVVGESAQAQVIETYAGLADNTYLTNGVTEIAADANAVVRHVKMERESPAAFHVATQKVHQERTTNVRTHNICLGGDLVRNDLFTRANGEGSDHLMNGLFVLKDDQHVDNHTAIDHAAPDCNSHQLYKGIVGDEARGVFYGTILVRKHAQRTDADQHNPNLLVSDKALVDTTPQLEIFADDVRCTHGSTFGQLDQDQVFYLQSRGYDEEVARSLLTYAFAGEVIRDIEIPEVRDTVRDLVLQRLPRGDLVRDAL